MKEPNEKKGIRMLELWRFEEEERKNYRGPNLLRNSLFFVVFAAFSSYLVTAPPVFAQPQTPPNHVIPFYLDSGQIVNGSSDVTVIWSDTVHVEGSQWLRLKFSQLILPEEPVSHKGSILRIVSVLDGAVQTLDAVSAHQWKNTSAYFNGDTVNLELIAAPDGMVNQVTIDSITVGDPFDQEGLESICDGTDDRVLENDNAIGRGLPAGCTAWIFNDANHCLLTAGHCSDIGNEVIEFNVPLSKRNGTIVHPGPEDQYAVDPDSQQFDDTRMGEDWSYFGCFPNSQTGLTPYQAQGEFYEIDFPRPPIFGNKIKLPGFGTVSPPVNPRWNQIDKVNDGAYSSFNDSILKYRTDSSGGNSGSPVVFEQTGRAIGIHTHGGCGDGSGANAGTGMNNKDLQDALDHPKGVCLNQDCINLIVDHLRIDQWAEVRVTKGNPGDAVTVLWATSLGSYIHEGTNWCVDFGLNIPEDNVKLHIAAQGVFDEDGEFSQGLFMSDKFSGKKLHSKRRSKIPARTTACQESSRSRWKIDAHFRSTWKPGMSSRTHDHHEVDWGNWFPMTL